MMIPTIKPYGSIGDKQILYRFELNGKFYIVDTIYNRIEVSEQDYKKLRCPIKKYRESEE